MSTTGRLRTALARGTPGSLATQHREAQDAWLGTLSDERVLYLLGAPDGRPPEPDIPPLPPLADEDWMEQARRG